MSTPPSYRPLKPTAAQVFLISTEKAKRLLPDVAPLLQPNPNIGGAPAGEPPPEKK